jgi:cation transport regulator
MAKRTAYKKAIIGAREAPGRLGQIMPYRTRADLPQPIRHVLAAEAQEIYREAFNGAWRQYRAKDPRYEEIAHRVAWTAVKRRYRKVAGKWLPRE